MENKENKKRYNKKYRIKNKERITKKQKDWIKKNRDKVQTYHKLWNKSNPKRVKSYAKRSAIRVKCEVLYAYGGNPPKCACCGEKDIRFLTIDHIKNNGAEERRKLKITGGGYNFYYYLKKNGFPKNGYQVLCYNCNCGRRYYNICPHKLKG